MLDEGVVRVGVQLLDHTIPTNTLRGSESADACGFREMIGEKLEG